jgi:adenylate cyclase
MPGLQIQTFDGRRLFRLLDKDQTDIGRQLGNDITLAEAKVSRAHASIIKEGGHFILIDRKSQNGTFVNGVKLERSVLKSGDTILIGGSTLVFVTEKDGERWNAPPPETHRDEIGDTIRKIIPSSGGAEGGLSSMTLLAKPGAGMSPLQKTDTEPTLSGADEKKDLASLEKANRVLYVLYEISRRVTAVSDFHDLLEQMMDLIFQVVAADFGFLVLTEDGEGAIQPVVTKLAGASTHNSPGISRTILKKVITDRVAVLTSNAMEDDRLKAAQSIQAQQIRSSLCVPLWEENRIIGAIQLNSLRPDRQFSPEDLEFLNSIGCQMASVIHHSRLNQRLRDEELLIRRLERYHSPQVVDHLLHASAENLEDLMEAREIPCTVVFTDIVGFTRLSEHMPPKEVSRLLNRYFSRMTDIIFAYDGTLDKFIGDCLMAVFGSPRPKKDDAVRAVRAASEILDKFKSISGEGGPDIRVRIGINTGPVVAGNIGSPNRMEYTVLGDTVNVASRLQELAQPGQIILGPETARQIKKSFRIKDMGEKRIRGRENPLMVYTLLP